MKQVTSTSKLTPSSGTNQFLPRSWGQRVVVALLALPSFLILLAFLVAFPLAYIPWPPKSVMEGMMLCAICEVLAAACLFALLALIWAIAAPKWLGTLLESGSRRLAMIAGGFMVSTGAALIVVMSIAGEWIPLTFAVGGLALGIRMLYLAARHDWPIDRSAESRRADGRS